jgi:hypothetical protein
MKLAIIGATGNLGGVVARGAAARGQRITALSNATVDVTDPASIRGAVAGHNAVVVAVKGPHRPGSPRRRALLEALPARA